MVKCVKESDPSVGYNLIHYEFICDKCGQERDELYEVDGDYGPEQVCSYCILDKYRLIDCITVEEYV